MEEEDKEALAPGLWWFSWKRNTEMGWRRRKEAKFQA